MIMNIKITYYESAKYYEDKQNNALIKLFVEFAVERLEVMLNSIIKSYHDTSLRLKLINYICYDYYAEAEISLYLDINKSSGLYDYEMLFLYIILHKHLVSNNTLYDDYKKHNTNVYDIDNFIKECIQYLFDVNDIKQLALYDLLAVAGRPRNPESAWIMLR